ncbi:Netrin receptor unc5c [Blomia tropicalis]|nr:Netrin receptor unc5c [Blomia tropicalis]
MDFSVDLYNNGKYEPNRDTSLLPLLPSESESHLSSSSSSSSSSLIPFHHDQSGGILGDPQLLPKNLDGSPIDLTNLNPKGLKFEEEPADSYIVRSKSAILRCKTLNALNAWFTCNSGDERKIQSNQKINNYVDPEKGIRMIEIDLEVTRTDVEEHTHSGYTNPFQCWCTAYGGQHQIMSRKASVSFSCNNNDDDLFALTIDFGYNGDDDRSVGRVIWSWLLDLRKHFYHEPISKSVPIGSNQITFDCLPPDGEPKPTVFWMRNDVIIAETRSPTSGNDARQIGFQQSTKSVKNMKKFDRLKTRKQRRSTDSNVIIAPAIPDGATQHPEGVESFADPYVIRQVTALDNANFTCGVRNQAGVRFSSPALLNVFVNGEWSNWGSWSECLLPNSIMCGRGSKKRVRHCSNPTPVNSGQFCTGDPVQVAECIVPCATVEGTYWSAWSQWSPCSHECTQVRRRVCNNPSPEIGANDCFGPDYMVKNCTGGLCRKLFDPNHSIHPNMYPSNTLPIGPSPVQPAPANNAYTNEQIYFAIIFLLTLIIVLCAMYIGLKFVNRRRHRGAKSGFHSATNGWGDMIQLERGPIGSGTVPNEEDAQAMLLLLQQQQGHCAVPANVQLPMSGPMSSRYQNRTQSQPSQKRSAQFGTNSSTSSTSSSGGAGEKYQLISRLKHNIVNSNKPNLLLDHLVMRSIESGHHPPPLPTIPSVNSLNSYATGHSKSENNESEPDYAEPMINYGELSTPPIHGNGIGSNGNCGPRPPSIPPPITCSTPLLTRSGNHLHGMHAFNNNNNNNNNNTIADDITFGKHENSIVTVAFSRSPGTGPPPGIGSKLLNRPFVLCFKHCIAVRGNSIANLAKMLSNKNLTILWQDMADPHSQWIEVVRYGGENINTACYLEIDANNVYLITKLVGRYMLCLNMDVVPSTPFNHQSTMLANDFSKLINFSMTIEQFSNTEHLVKVYCYDDLPCSTLSLRNELSPSVGGGSNSIGSVRLRVGKNTTNSALRLSARGGPICFELKPPDSSRHRIKGMRRVEIPLNHIWYSINGTNVSSTTNMLIHCSFVVMNNHTIIRECTRKQCSNNEGIYENDNDDDNNDEPILVDDIDSDSDELVTEDDPESIVDDRPIRYINNNGASKHNRLQQNHQKRSNHHTNNMPMDHYHENENDLNYEVKIWQQPIKTTTNVSNGIVPISNIVLLNNSTTNRLCQPSNTASYYVERSIRHLFNETDRRIRTQLIEQLDQPRSDELDWRSFSSAAGFDHYMPFFATQPSPSTSIMELWEAKVLQQLTMKSTGNQMTIEMAEMKDIFYSKLVHLLQTIQRTDLIEIILSNQC